MQVDNYKLIYLSDIFYCMIKFILQNHLESNILSKQSISQLSLSIEFIVQWEEKWPTIL